jgi:hypothetical protein
MCCTADITLPITHRAIIIITIIIQIIRELPATTPNIPVTGITTTTRRQRGGSFGRENRSHNQNTNTPIEILYD